MQPPPPAAPPSGPAPAPPATDPVRVVVGLLLVVPAAIGLLVGYVWPTLRTAWLSLRNETLLTDGGESVGLDNYEDVASRQSAEAYLFASSLPLLPLVAVLVIGPLFAYAAHRSGRSGRWTTRLALTVPMVCFAPAAFAVSWVHDRGLGESEARAALWLTTFGLLAGVGVTIFLAVLRGRASGRSVWPAGLAVGAVAGLATIAVALQSFTYPALMGGTTPMTLFTRIGFQFVALGPGTAHGVVLLLWLLLLGLAAASVVVFSNLRLTVEPAERDQRPGSVGAAVAVGLGLVAVLVVTGYALWPWLTRLDEWSLGTGDLGPSEASVLVNTWLPPAVSTVVGVALAAAAGFGIGALRPFGRWSELLLLLFAPWLFIGVGPLALVKFQAAVDGLLPERVGTFFGLIPPVWVVVPALFLFTLLFKGLADRHRLPDGRPDYGRILLAALPMAGLLAAATWLVQSQSLLWGQAAGRLPDTIPAPLAMTTAAARLDPTATGIGLVLPVPAILVFAVGLGLLQIFYLDRLAVRVGRPDPVGHNQ